MSDKLKVYAIETKDEVYINENLKNSQYGYETHLRPYLFDGETAKETFHKSWLKIGKAPKRITHMQIRPDINQRFVLIDESFACGKIPKVLTREQAGNIEGYEFRWKPEYEIYKSLYKEISDPQEPIEVEDEFEYIVLAVIDDIKEPRKISYPFKETMLYGKSGDVTNDDISHSLIDQIVYPSLTIHERPCRLSSKQTYNIVREHIKLNINPKVARITSDFDFCFTVEKIIPLAKPYSYEHDSANSIFGGRKRKPQMRIVWVNDKKITCFEMTSEEDHYRGYTPIKSFEGKDEDDLKDQLDSYLEDLMTYINEPMKECEYCNGRGVLFNKDIEPVTAKG
jgi:hypothetical protein